MKLPKGYKKEDFNWVKIPIIGQALIILNAYVIDSDKQDINLFNYYNVGKHKISGKVFIEKIPLENPLKVKCVNGCLNELKLQITDNEKMIYICWMCGTTHATPEIIAYNENI